MNKAAGVFLWRPNLVISWSKLKFVWKEPCVCSCNTTHSSKLGLIYSERGDHEGAGPLQEVHQPHENDSIWLHKLGSEACCVFSPTRFGWILNVNGSHVALAATTVEGQPAGEQNLERTMYRAVTHWSQTWKRSPWPTLKLTKMWLQSISQTPEY